MTPKVRIIELLRELDSGKYSNILLNDYYKNNKIDKGEKGFITEVFYGVIRNRMFVDHLISKFTVKIGDKDHLYLLELSVYQAIFMNSDEAGVVWEAVEIAKKEYGSSVAGFINGVLRNVFRNREKIENELRIKGRLDVLYTYPKWSIKRFKELYGDKAEAVMKAYKKSAKLSVRVNRLKYNEEAFNEYLADNGIKVLYKMDKVYYLEGGDIINSDLFRTGKIIAQDGASYLAVKALSPAAGDIVLDACAAPGTKSTLMAEFMDNSGRINAIDIYDHKLKLIRENAEKTGVDIISEVLGDSTAVEEIFEEELFDKILADVPCSGFGVLRKKPEVVFSKKESDIKNLVELQRGILNSVSKKLKVGGEMVYSTCTIFPEENTDNIEWFLENNKNFKVENIDFEGEVKYIKDRLGGISLSYENEYLDGFYIIKLKREM